MKGKLPITGKIILESDEPQWMMLINGLIKDLKTTALVHLEEEEKPGRINLVIKDIIPPDRLVRSGNKVSTETNMEREVSLGLSRLKAFLNDYLDKTTWLFIGYIDGEVRIPILITYYCEIKITIYTQKLKREETNAFFPINPRLN